MGTVHKRADAQRNEAALLDAAAATFVEAGVDAPVREIAARAGVGVGTIYRHFPTRADLVVAVYRHQVEDCAAAAPGLLESEPTAYGALVRWIDLFVDFVETKHGLAGVLQSGDPMHTQLHGWFVDLLVPACESLLAAAAREGQVAGDLAAYELMRAVGNLCIGASTDDRYDARRVVRLLVTGLRID